MGVESGSRRHGARRAAWTFTTISLTVCAATAALYGFAWRPFVAELRDLRPDELLAPRHVDAATMRLLGSLRGDRTSSFTRFEAIPEPGTRRLCAFGDSYTYGDEVADGHDYPAFLAEELARSGHDDVEVLNFGNSWYGFHQTFLLWEALAGRFGCDVSLLGPDGFQPDRDTTFNHTGLAYPYYLHARFVLEGEGLRRIDVAGNGARERFDGYFRFAPMWRYLRYDRHAPAALQSLAGLRPVLPNPFYYRIEDAHTEALETYRRLLARMRSKESRVILVHARADVVEMALSVDNPTLTAVHIPRRQDFPQAAPGGHASAFGNRWIAQVYRRLLFDDAPTARAIVVEAPATQPLILAEEPHPVSAFARIEVLLDGQVAGFLATVSADPAARGGTPQDLAGSPARCLLALYAPGSSAADATWFVLDQPPDGAFVGWGAFGHEDAGRAALRPLAAEVGVYEAQVPGWVAGDTPALAFEAGLPTAMRTGAGLELRIGARVLARGLVRDGGTPKVAWQPTAPVSMRQLRSGAGQYASAVETREHGRVTLRFSGAPVRGDVEVTLGNWRYASQD